MALSDKNIVITPNNGAALNPKIVFSGADASTIAQNITITALPTNSGTLSFDGSSGQLFSITNSFTGTIFSVNDISGIPSIELLDTGVLKLAQYGGSVGVGIVPSGTYKLEVGGGVAGTVLTSTVATGTAPFAVTSTTAVANLSIGGNAGTATSLAGGATGAIPYQSNTGVTAMTAAGTTGQVLTTPTTGSAPTWVTPTSGFQRTITTLSPTAGTTVFTVTYTVGYIDVFQNGVKLVIADDFVATNGTSVTLSVATLTDDLIEFITYTSFSGNPGYTAPRSTTITSSATPSINTDTTDMFGITAQAVAITGFTVTGTPVNGQKLWIYITGTATQSITWGTSFESATATLPVTTVGTSRLDIGFIWNIATSKWRCLATG